MTNKTKVEIHLKNGTILTMDAVYKTIKDPDDIFDHFKTTPDECFKMEWISVKKQEILWIKETTI